jgi:sialate O-acetylesterase
VSYFSATAFYFGRELHRELDVPVGLMVSAVNGTRIEPWTAGVGVRVVKALDGIDKPTDGDLYTVMVKPFTRIGIRGVIWYQGEGNVGDGMRYADRMRALVGGWRQEWDRGEFPLYYVQLCPLNWGGKPVDAHPRLWEAQTAARDIPNTGMVVTTDVVGHVGDAHPRNKQAVGQRLAAWALAKTYGKTGVAYSGPVFKGLKIEGDKARLRFDFADGLRSRDGKPLSWFTVAGADGKFVPATAEVDGETVVVSAAAVAKPVHVRFGWHQIAEPNLENKHGLPAGPFRTDKD